MPSRKAIELGSDLETRDGVLVQDHIAPRGLPAPYGSKDDTRASDITQLHLFPEMAQVSDATALMVADEYLDVRPLSETPRLTPDKQIFYTQTTVAVDLNTDIPFKAQTLRIDNYTNNWVFVPQLRRFVPPDWYGAVFNATGIASVTLLWQAPPGLVQPAPTAGTIITVIAHQERCPEVAGTKRI